MSVVGGTLCDVMDGSGSHAVEQPESGAQDPSWLLVDALACIVHADPREASIHLAHMNARGTTEGQRCIVAELWRCEHPQVVEALELIARHHPDAVVTREARKSVLRAHGRLAGV